jgi:hypothetical protein
MHAQLQEGRDDACGARGRFGSSGWRAAAAQQPTGEAIEHCARASVCRFPPALPGFEGFLCENARGGEARGRVKWRGWGFVRDAVTYGSMELVRRRFVP